jgi:hypothetical protein
VSCGADTAAAGLVLLHISVSLIEEVAVPDKRDVACGGDTSIDNNSRGDISDNWDASVKVLYLDVSPDFSMFGCI